MWIDTQVDLEGAMPLWWLESVLWDISSGFPLPSHLALSGSESLFGMSQDPPMCTCASLNQYGFH